MARRILVTGAAGFIGSHLALALTKRGDHVLGIDSLNTYYDPQLKRDRLAHIRAHADGRFAFTQVDFSDWGALGAALDGEDFDAIAHLGAQAGVRHSIEQPQAYVVSNLAGHLNLLEVARARMVPMAYASSSSVYGANPTLPFRVEDRVDRPLSLYAATKKADELMSESYAHLYRIPLTGLRFFTVYGPWGRPDMAMWIFTRKILAGEPIAIFNHGQMKRDFTYIDDIIAGVVACLDSPPPDDGLPKPGGSVAPHRVYNIGNHRAEPLMDMVRHIERATGKTALCDLQPLQPGDVVETYADIDAIAKDLGFHPITPIADGVPAFVQWYRNHYQV